MKESKNCVTVTKDGPYKVSAGTPLSKASIATNADGDSVSWVKGKNYDTGEKDYSLCRCGRSKQKPFCDGEHAKINFVGEEIADRQPYLNTARRYSGTNLDLLDDESLCVGARFCDRAGTAWHMVRSDNDPDIRNLVVEEAWNCPSGRLTVVTREGKPIEPDLPEEIGLVNDPASNCRGPLWLKGGIRVQGAGGEEYEVRNRVTLCRCGESSNMPYCDASHYECPHMQGQDD